MKPGELIAELQKMPENASLRWFLSKHDGLDELVPEHWTPSGHEGDWYEVDCFLIPRPAPSPTAETPRFRKL